MRRKICERFVEVTTRAEQILARAEAGPLRLGRRRHDARYWQISAGHEDLLARLDSSQELGEVRLGLGKIDDVHVARLASDAGRAATKP
jgi:hypothetical protein